MSATTYLSKVHNALRYYPTWFPNTPLKLGDIGIMQKKQFRRIDNLKNLGIDFTPSPETAKKDDAFSFATEGTFSGNAGLSGKANEALTETKGKLQFSFSNGTFILFKPKGLRMQNISDQINLAKQIKQKREEGIWKREYVVITEIIKAASADIYISKSKNGTFELELKSDLGNEEVSLADAQLDFKINENKALDLISYSGEDLTPLYLISGIRKFWRGFGPRSKSTIKEDDPNVEDSFDEIPFDLAE